MPSSCQVLERNSTFGAQCVLLYVEHGTQIVDYYRRSHRIDFRPAAPLSLFYASAASTAGRDDTCPSCVSEGRRMCLLCVWPTGVCQIQHVEDLEKQTGNGYDLRWGSTICTPSPLDLALSSLGWGAAPPGQVHSAWPGWPAEQTQLCLRGSWRSIR